MKCLNGISFVLIILILLLSWSGSTLANSWDNPATLNRLITPEFNIKLQLSNGAPGYDLSYVEPNYGTGAGLIGFRQDGSIIKATYAVAQDIIPYTEIGFALNYINYFVATDSDRVGEKYVSTDLGFQFGDFWWVRFGVLIENLWHLVLGETGTPLKTNIVPSVTGDLAKYGQLTVEFRDPFSRNLGRKLNLKLELTPIEMLRLRAGWSQPGDDWSIGVGFQYQQMGFDYDWRFNGHQFGFRWQF